MTTPDQRHTSAMHPPLAYVVHLKTPGLSGGETRSYQMAQALGRLVDGLHLYGQVDPTHEWGRVSPHRLKTPFPLGIRQLLRDFKTLDVNVAIERYQFPPFNVAALTQIIRRKPIILEVHGFPIEEYILQAQRGDATIGLLSKLLAQVPEAIWLRVQRWLFRRVAHFIVTSAGTKAILITLGVPAERVSVVYNCVDPALFDMTQHTQTAARQRLGLPQDRRIVLYAGSMMHEELGIVLEAARPDALYLLVGGGDLQPLTAKARQLGLNDDTLRFMPAIPHQQMPELLSAVDVVLAPYSLGSARFKAAFHYSPLKIMEALAMGKPVVTVDADELHAVFDGLPNVHFVESGDSASWEAGIRQALAMVGDAALGQGRDFILNGYRWEDAAAHYLTIIEGLGQGETST